MNMARAGTGITPPIAKQHGAKFVENLVQGIARDILCYAMQTLKNCAIVGHVHDEIIIEADRRMSVEAVCEQMGRKYAGYADRYAALESRMDGLKKERERREIQHDLFSGFLSGLEEVRELPVDFSGKLFHRMVDYATVHSDGRVVFTFRNGAEVSIKI